MKALKVTGIAFALFTIVGLVLAACASPSTPTATSQPVGGGTATQQAQMIATGQSLYRQYCAGCHGENGQGVSGPPLDGDPVATAQDPTRAIQQVLNGRGPMPAFGSTLSDEQIAEILSYVRQAWNNNASFVEPQQVTQAR